MQALLDLDSQLLLFLNYFHTDFWDNFMWIISSTTVWIPLYVMILYTIIKNQKYQSWISVIAIIILIVLCDRVSSGFLKPTIARFRPTHDPLLQDFVKIVNGYRGGTYGFVSSHAANTMGIAVFTSLVFRNKVFSAFIFIWALIISYSRIYLGVHFPGDVLGGLLLGSIIALIVYKIYITLTPRFIRLTFFNGKGLKRGVAEQFQCKDILQIVFAGIISFAIILLSSKVLI
ncbi:phosphatase PAP2 family protein [Saccharicrinis aurantiacus]|uniref:phosphatase PAP2 family protein n=1 Tax=Saccharicrinis aurantiacus TaxID=1849719 RepID=UPI000838D5C2|nr:phosphatase PAP2 family protein [Saccharicrinis aurantiacus]